MSFASVYVRPWLSPFPLAMGALAPAMFAFLAAVYLALATDDAALREDFAVARSAPPPRYSSPRSAGSLVAQIHAPRVSGVLMGSRSFVLQMATAIAAIAALWAIWTTTLADRTHRRRDPGLADPLGWVLVQYPFVVPPSLTLRDAAAPRATLELLLGALVGGAVILFPRSRLPLPHLCGEGAVIEVRASRGRFAVPRAECRSLDSLRSLGMTVSRLSHGSCKEPPRHQPEHGMQRQKRRRERKLLQSALRGGAAGLIGGVAIAVVERELLSRISWRSSSSIGMGRHGGQRPVASSASTSEIGVASLQAWRVRSSTPDCSAPRTPCFVRRRADLAAGRILVEGALTYAASLVFPDRPRPVMRGRRLALRRKMVGAGEPRRSVQPRDGHDVGSDGAVAASGAAR